MEHLSLAYDRILQSDPSRSLKAMRRFDDQLYRHDCRFGKTAIPSFLKPYFLSERNTAELQRIIRHLMNMLEKIIRAYFKYPELRAIYHLPRGVEAWMEIDPGFERSIVVARPDAFLTEQGFRFIEFNCDSPAGAGYADIEQQLMRRTFGMRALEQRYEWDAALRMPCLLKALLACYREFGGSGRHPHIAIVDWDHVKTVNEFRIIKRYFESRGYPTRIVDPRKIRFRKGKVWAGKFQVDLIYRRVIFNELWQKRAEVQDFLKAYRLGKVCVANPFRSRLAANKSILSILTNPDYDRLFTPEEIRVRDRHLPWTRRVLDTRKIYKGKQVSLKRMIETERKRLVLKPADRYGGYGVTIGHEVPPSRWTKVITRALRKHENWVVQDLVPIPRMTVPFERDGSLCFAEKKMNINPFIFNGEYAGAMVRLSDQSVINVSAGGGLIPVVSYRAPA